MQFYPNWLFNKVYKKQLKQEIEELADNIERNIAIKAPLVAENSDLKEMYKLTNAINKLIMYFENRSSNEKDFSANASHELRTPLAGIRLQTEIAMSTDDKEIQNRAHENVLKAIDQNERLIEQLLVLARHTVGNGELVTEKVDLSKMSKDIVSDLQNHALEKHISLKIKVSKGLIILANEKSISVLIHNLISNAINHTPNNSSIRVVVNKINNKIMLSVIDNGPGIPKEHYKEVLQRFKKVNNSNNPGSGLGLAIAKRICDLHDATLRFEQATSEGGLKVTVVFNL